MATMPVTFDAVPDTFPVTLPVRFPETFPVTLPTRFPERVPPGPPLHDAPPLPSAVRNMPDDAGLLSILVPLTLAHAALPAPSAMGAVPAGANVGGFFTM